MYLLRIESRKIFYDLVVKMRICCGLAIEIYQLARSEEHRSAQLQYAVVAQSLNYNFGANAVNIATGYTDYRFVHFVRLCR